MGGQLTRVQLIIIKPYEGRRGGFKSKWARKKTGVFVTRHSTPALAQFHVLKPARRLGKRAPSSLGHGGGEEGRRGTVVKKKEQGRLRGEKAM